MHGLCLPRQQAAALFAANIALVHAPSAISAPELAHVCAHHVATSAPEPGRGYARHHCRTLTLAGSRAPPHTVARTVTLAGAHTLARAHKISDGGALRRSLAVQRTVERMGPETT